MTDEAVVVGGEGSNGAENTSGVGEAITPAAAAPSEAGTTEAAEAAPQAYQWSVPDGVSLNQELLGEYESFAREQGMSQEVAQKLLDFGVKLQAVTGQQAEQEFLAQRQAWEQEARTSKTIGGENFDANLANAKSALEKVAAPGLMEVLNASNWGSHPAFIETMMNIAKLVNEDTFRFGRPPAGEQDRAKRMFPTMN